MGKSHFGLSSMARPWYSKPRASSNLNLNSKEEQIGEEQRVQMSKDSKQTEEQCRKALAQATIPIETRISNGERMWDQDFSSMSSYSSHDLEVYKIVQSSKQDFPDYNSESETQQDHEASSSRDSGSASFSCSVSSEGVVLGDEEQSKRKNYSKLRRQRSGESLSAELPQDVEGPTKNSIPLVMQSFDPYRDFRDSIRQMVWENGIYEWQELQELLYCYITLNSCDLHDWIRAAFVDVLLELQNECCEDDESYDWP